MLSEAVTPEGNGQAKQQVVAYTEKSQDKHESRHIQLVREYGFHPRTKVQVEDGAVLPRKFEPFPSNMYGLPLEEIDTFIYEETFCVVSKRFRKNYIHRFTGTKSLFLFPPWNPARRVCVYIATNQLFDYFVMATILFNCIFLAMSETIEEAEFVFLAIYSVEMFIKIIAKGFVLNKYTYLRNPWNWLDFVVITSGYATIGLDVGNLAGLRTFRVLRALKTVSIMPGLKTIINALLHSFKQLAEVMTLTIFCLMVFALFALQVYMGELRNKCVKNLPFEWTNVTNEEWYGWINDTENWIYDNDELPTLCGNLTGARHCPPNFTCLCVGENPNHGYTNFDNFLWSMLTTFQLITLDYWENVYNMVLATCGPLSVSFFTIVVFFGSFYLINLMLAVVALSYEEEAEITQEERRKDLIDHRDDSTFSFDPAHLNLKQLTKQSAKKTDQRKNMLLASYSRKKTKRRKKGKEGGGGGGNGGGNGTGGGKPSSNNSSEAKDDSPHKSRSATPSPSPSPRHSSVRPQALSLTKNRGLLQQAQLNQLQQQALTEPLNNEMNETTENLGAADPNGGVEVSNSLHPLGVNYRGQLQQTSRQASSNRDSSLDDSGVVDDHEDTQDNELVHASTIEVTLALSPKEVKIIKCNGNNIARIKKQHEVYALNPDYLSQIVVIDDTPDRNCEYCLKCCLNYGCWLSFQNNIYKIVKDPLFELFITLCIVLNTTFLALEHHGMSETVRSVLDIGNKVFTLVFTLECIMKVTSLSRDFFQCGWNIFDLIIVTASICDLIFELVDGLSVLRGLRLLRVLKLAQSWITMRVLLSIILSTIGALGNLTFILVIVIYIFAVIGMQLFAKDYTPDKFDPDPVPRWNFNDFFHSFMMIFRILCGEWIEPLWDCMRAEEAAGTKSSCFAIFLPALVMGNFMVLNLFLALLLNSFNSEELKSKKEEVGDESKLAKSFERLRSIVRKGGFRKKDVNENEPNSSKLEKLVKEIVIQQRNEKKGILVDPNKKYSEKPTVPFNSLSYQETFNRPLSGSDFAFDITNNKVSQALKTISGSQETVTDMDDQRQLPSDDKREIMHQMSSGFGTQQSKDESLEMATQQIIQQTPPNANWLSQSSKRQSFNLPKRYRLSLTSPPNAGDTNSNSSSCTYSEISRHLKRLSSNQSINTLSLDQEELLNHTNLKDELLNCDKKELFQFLNDDYDVYIEPPFKEREQQEQHVQQTDPTKRKSVVIMDNVKEMVISPGDGKKVPKTPSHTKISELNELTGKPWHCLVSYVDDLTVGGRKNSQGVFNDPMAFPSFTEVKPAKVPIDCFPDSCYKQFSCFDDCIKTNVGQKWMHFRTKVLNVVDTPVFEWFILFLIFASSVTLCFEDIHLDKNPDLKRILYWTNFGFSLIFVIEMFMKWIALGFKQYFSSFWTILDFIIVFVSVFSLLIEENENLKVLRSLRTLRALRPLRAISRWQGMKIVVNALMYAIPSIFNVLLVCLVFWLIFSIMGVQFFGGKFFKCVDEDGEMLDVSIVNDRMDCQTLNYSWVNSKITFDHVGMGYLALFQVATFEGWMEVMADSVDARGVDLQPQREANLYAYIYFVIFIICGSFFTLNLFIGVIIDNFNMLKKRYEGGILEMFLTPSQKSYYCAMKKLGRKKPQRVIKRPLNQVMAMFYDLANSRRFEIAIFVLIFLNMLSMGIEHYNQPHAVFFILEVSNAFFTTVFGLECCVKIIGLRYHYFTVPWNVFDFVLVFASIFGILMEDVMIDLPISPTLLRVVRVFRIGRILRLIKAAKGIRKLLFALIVSLPALFNIGALLALITFIYAILGMSLFGHVKQVGALNDMINFETFGRSMQLLFRLMTSAGWNDVLESLMIQPPHCDIHKETSSNGDCGYPLLAITYFTSFIIISYMIVINMYIAIILENFNQAHQEEEVGIVEDDLEMFYIRWSKYDPHASQFISFSQLSDFLHQLDPPLGIPKPNTLALVYFNLPISQGDKVHCLDILHALVKHVLGHVDESDTFKQLQDQMDVKFRKQFPTRKEIEIISSTRIWKREERAARSIQNAWREYVRLKRERERSPMSLEDEQTSSPGGWQGKLSALNFLHLQIHRRCSRTSSRCSSRKSSRASDGSDLSELAGPWLNLPLMMGNLPGTGDLVKDMKGPPDLLTKDGLATTPSDPRTRRKSIYSFFLGRQDAVELTTPNTSPSVHKKNMKPSETIFSLNTEGAQTAPTPPTKSKRATSFIKKKPPLERGLSAQSALRLNRNAILTDTNSPSDVSILVTQPSPEVPIGPNLNLTSVHVLVHRESEEYQTDLDEICVSKKEQCVDVKKIKTDNMTLSVEPHPLVTICVESPKDSPNDEQKSIAQVQTPVESIINERSGRVSTSNNNSTTIDHESSGEAIKIDVNAVVDTSNIFYDY